ncbi:MAG TPA: ornithine carbamoyltransferase, partial [Armatimonadetes bacterium]|nr:ornithine carbamoyltransferase [Armatimonadota bacterium]
MLTMERKHRDFLSVADLKPSEVRVLFQWSSEYKSGLARERLREPLLYSSVALIFEKPSLRTRVTFELAVQQLGGHPIVLTQAEIGMGKREAISDIARNLERWVDVIVARVYAHETLEELAQWAHVPVINALSDREHPCQVLADLFTLQEHFDDVRGRHLVFIGDGFNVAHSLLLLCAMLGTHVTVVTPPSYEPHPNIVEQAQALAQSSGARISIGNDPMSAVSDADAIYTDVWVSMGQEEEREKRKRDFAPYQVNEELLKHAPEHAVVMHCLP